ncbi:D-amino-acid transaminase [Spiribacter vilamensis]|uniref:Aminodeoxychorismate lyase n=1 Tax=Spiribacter vilamensis TaxID=531306 RepID=A0A4Q8CYI1_9GAMM|nr:D-amino-acid transaminase [Spiribacter vilamensis]RZU98038.1 D-alanine aminotransferase [Spiribacter vilamensis]TVO61057.1 D-amino-acid transaminase [Spiribacter vilamensis]
MSRIVHVNGEFLPEASASLSIFDRGVLFADAVYEVTAVLDGGLVDFDAHQARLRRSLAELAIDFDPVAAGLIDLHRELIRRNDLQEGLVYLQISRGVADRSFLQPANIRPSVVLFTQAQTLLDAPAAQSGLSVITRPDKRWHRRDIKTTQLLYPSMMKTLANEQGADDVWMVEAGHVTEGSSSNAHIITADGSLVTRPTSEDILHGITRAAVLDYARETGAEVIERPFTVAEAQEAREAFITSATAFVTPVVAVDGVPVGDGRPGPATRRIRAHYIDHSRDRLRY